MPLIYFRLRLCLANIVNTYLRLKIYVLRRGWGGILRPKCVLIQFAITNLSLIYFLILFVRVVNSQRLYCSLKMVLNVGIEAFWYTKIFV